MWITRSPRQILFTEEKAPKNRGVGLSERICLGDLMIHIEPKPNRIISDSTVKVQLHGFFTGLTFDFALPSRAAVRMEVTHNNTHLPEDVSVCRSGTYNEKVLH
jgi:hypothetical protein